MDGARPAAQPQLSEAVLLKHVICMLLKQFEAGPVISAIEAVRELRLRGSEALDRERRKVDVLYDG